MSRFKLVNLIDKLFITICVFLLSFAWINFYVRNLQLTFVFSLFVTFSVCFVMFFIYNKKTAKKHAQILKTEQIETFSLAFKLLPSNEKLALLEQVFDVKLKTQGEFFITENNHVFACFSGKILTENDYFSILSKAQSIGFNHLTIIVDDYEKQVKLNLLKGKVVEIVDKKNLFATVNKKSINLNTENINLSATKFSWRDFMLNLFKPNKAKSYFLCGLVLLFSSIILPYNYYYIIVGSMLMLFALICKILPKFKG